MYHQPLQPMRRRTIGHVDIAHFRAPYKNSMMGFGADAATAVTKGADGVWVIAPGAIASWGDYVVAPIGAGAAADVELVRPAMAAVANEKAASWISRMVGEGRWVMFGANVGAELGLQALRANLTSGTPIPDGVKLFLRNGIGPDLARTTGDAVTPMFAVLAPPAPGTTTPGATPGLSTASMASLPVVALVAVGVSGALYFIFRKKRS